LIHSFIHSLAFYEEELNNMWEWSHSTSGCGRSMCVGSIISKAVV